MYIGDAYDKKYQHRALIKEVNESIRYSLRSYWSAQPHKDVAGTAFQPLYSVKLQNGLKTKICE